uniref:Putative ovule protein n=1 Tax=Solanum chacoense TaxID=4108 RepID=A0A0V0H5R3_SOLCH
MIDAIGAPFALVLASVPSGCLGFSFTLSIFCTIYNFSRSSEVIMPSSRKSDEACQVFTARSVPLEKLENSISSSPQ